MNFQNYFPSWNAMISIDLSMLAISIAAIVFVAWKRKGIKEAGALPGSVTLLAGLCTGSLLYIGDLTAMIVMPQFISMAPAMDFMANLHLRYSWYLNSVSLALLMAGIFLTVSRLLSHAQTSQSLAESERALRRSLEADGAEKQAVATQLRTLIDAFPLHIAYRKRDGTFTLINKTAESWIGRPEHDLIGKEFMDVYGSDTRRPDEPGSDAEYRAHRFEERATAVMAGEEVSYEFTRRFPDGVERHCRATYAPHFIADGEIVGMFVLLEDISIFRETEAGLAKSEARFRDFAELSSDWLFETDDQHRLSWLSEGFHEKSTVPASEILGTTLWDSTAYPLAGPEQLVEQQRIMEAHESIREFTYSLTNEKGEKAWRRMNADPTFDEEGRFTGYRGSTTDITEYRKSQDSFEEQRRILETLIDNIPAYISLKNVNGEYVFANQLLCDVLGLSLAEIIGQTAADVTRTNPNSKYAELTARALATGEPIMAFKTTSEFNPGKIISVSFIPVRDQNGKIEFLLTLSLDVTEAHEQANMLHQAQKTEAIGQLTGGVAHDFNNVMTSINGNAYLVKELADGNPELSQFADGILRSVTRGASLTQRLLAFSRQQALSPRAVDISALLESLTEMLSRTLGVTIRIDIRYGEGIWPAHVDPNQLENAIVNLSLNARDAMPGGGRLNFEVSNTTLDGPSAATLDGLALGDYIMISVKDNGTGMAPEDLKRVFEPFFTTKPVGEGSGLGLSMVFGFAKQSNGHITLNSEPGRGTTAQLYLPRSEVPVSSEVMRDDAVPAYPANNRKVLIVEDDADVRTIPVTVLHRDGYRVHEAANGREALSLLATEGPFDILFTDIVLPGGISGMDLAEVASSEYPDIKILYTSGYNEQPVAGDTPAEPFLRKPYTPRDLSRRMRKMLND